MNIQKLQQDILRCQHVIGEIMIQHYDHDSYKEFVDRVFKDLFKDYLNIKTVEYTEQQQRQIKNECPNKLEPKVGIEDN